MTMIQALKPTSKATLKMQCLVICKADIEEATKLYDFFARDMPDLPDYDPPPQTVMDTTKRTVSDLVTWLRENGDTIAAGYEVVRQMTGGRLPPLVLPAGGEAAPSAGASVLPPINGQ